LRILAYTALLIAAGVWPAAAFDGPTQTTGGNKRSPASGSSAKPGAKGAGEAKSKTAARGQKLYDAGIKAYKAGKPAEAIKHLGSAIRAGGLEKPQMAKALYYRGLAFRKKGKPGQAISDLTSAIWLKDGLTTAEKSEAISSRNAAYREAGISSAPAATESVVVATPAAVKTEAVAANAPTSSGGSASGWQTATSASTAVPSSKAPSPSPQPVVAAAPASNSSTSASQSSSSSSGSSGGGVSGFFNSITNLFTGGGSSSQPAPSDSKEAVTTASIAPKPKTSSWSQTTEVATTPPAKPKKPAQIISPFSTQVAAVPPPAKPKKPTQITAPFSTQVAAVPPPAKPKKPTQITAPFSTQVAAVPPPAKPKTPAQDSAPFSAPVATSPPPAAAAKPSKPKVESAPSGKFRLQVAAVRSRREADAVVANLVQKYGGKLGKRRPVVDEAVIGSMGTFYRVRVGPYADAKEPQQLCGTLRISGFDCLVVTK